MSCLPMFGVFLTCKNSHPTFFSQISLHIDYKQSQICSVLNFVQVNLKTEGDILTLFDLDLSNKMAEGIKSLESILEKHIPEEELKEVNRIIFGKELG